MNGKVRETLPLAITVRWASLFNDRGGRKIKFSSGGVVLHK